MAVKIWIVAVISMAVVAVVTYICAPIFFIITGTFGSYISASDLPTSVKNIGNQLITLGTNVFFLAIALAVGIVLIWAYVRSVHKEQVSYQYVQ